MTTTDTDRYNKIASKLTLPIPHPTRPPATPKGSGQKLKTGDHLVLRVKWFAPMLGHLPEGTPFTVATVDSQGVVLTDDRGRRWRWENIEWTKYFLKVPKPRRKKGTQGGTK
jgi:hypothetical protein